jgi:hypothetical protein
MDLDRQAGYVHVSVSVISCDPGGVAWTLYVYMRFDRS